MALITVTDKNYNQNNLLYVQSVASDILSQTDSKVDSRVLGSRSVLTVDCDDGYSKIIKAEIADKLAEVVAINYKYAFFDREIKICGLTSDEKEILMASLIAADLEEDKRYVYERLKRYDDIALDGIYNFRLKPLKNKWKEIVSYMPSCFVNSQLKDFVLYLLENKKKRVYVDCGKVYDCHYKRLKRCSLLGGGDRLNIIREVLLSNCGEVEVTGILPSIDEFYIREFFADKIYFSNGYFS